MKIIIPLNGKGNRFVEKGYSDFKPFIKVLGTDILKKVIDSLNIQSEELIILARKEFTKYNLETYLYKNFPNIKSKVIYLEKDTRGAAETLHLGLTQYYGNNFKDESFLAVDGDTIYQEDIISKITDKNNSAIFYTITNESAPIYSYIKLNDHNEVIDITEKVKISDLANTGAYYFNSTKTFCETFKKLLKENKTQKDEYYTSGIYKELINDKAIVKGIEVKQINVVGTPLQLQNHCLNKKGSVKRFVFDLDNTLVTHPTIKDDYTSVKPLEDNIKFLNYLKNQGHYIIIYTARRMKTHKGNVPRVVADIGEITLKTLKDFGIKYDEIQFGKPYADFYIDDLAINPLKENLQYSTGFYNIDTIESRPYNNVSIKDDTVTKTGNVKGEHYWYNNAPFYILNKFFPKILNISEDQIVLEKIEGTSLSHLYVSDLINDNILHKIISSLEEIHSFHDPINGNFNKNYFTKIEKRYKDHRELYDSLPDSRSILEDLKRFFEIYKVDIGTIIHGDPVFSNIFLTTNNDLKFIDVKGINMDEFTIYGDPLYDYAKVYQSILGYDFILLDKEPNNNIISQNRIKFEQLITNMGVDLVVLKHLTKSLIFSLLPLHSDPVKVQKYYNLIKSI